MKLVEITFDLISGFTLSAKVSPSPNGKRKVGQLLRVLCTGDSELVRLAHMSGPWTSSQRQFVQLGLQGPHKDHGHEGCMIENLGGSSSCLDLGQVSKGKVLPAAAKEAPLQSYIKNAGKSTRGCASKTCKDCGDYGDCRDCGDCGDCEDCLYGSFGSTACIACTALHCGRVAKSVKISTNQFFGPKN